MNGEWNPRYLCYCNAHGKTPADMLAHDEPRGSMVNFILWNNEQWRTWEERFRPEWKIQRRQGWLPAKGQQDHDDYDAWLQIRYPPLTERRPDD